MTPKDKSLLSRFLPDLTSTQWEQLEVLPSLYQSWNTKVNVISRQDIGNIVEKHILHSIAISLYSDFVSGSKIIDVGTGGGFPGIPLAILYPECSFTLVDSIGKKIKVVQSIVESLRLSNVQAIQIRVEQFVEDRFHFMVSRAAMPMVDLVHIGRMLIDTKEQQNNLRNGVIALKGGDLTEELRTLRSKVQTIDLSDYLVDIPFYATKKIVYYPI